MRASSSWMPLAEFAADGALTVLDWLAQLLGVLGAHAGPVLATVRSATRRALCFGARDVFLWDDGRAVDVDTCAPPSARSEERVWRYLAAQHVVLSTNPTDTGKPHVWPWMMATVDEDGDGGAGDGDRFTAWVQTLRFVPTTDGLPPRPAALMTLYAHATGRASVMGRAGVRLAVLGADAVDHMLDTTPVLTPEQEGVWRAACTA